MDKPTKQEAYKAFAEADDRFSRALFKSFGKRAGDVRYTPEGKGEAGTVLRMIHDLRAAAQQVWFDAIERERSGDPRGPATNQFASLNPQGKPYTSEQLGTRVYPAKIGAE